MAYGYKSKSDIELTWVENREQLTLQGRQLLRRVMDKALVELDKEFISALNRGEVLSLSQGTEDLKKFMLSVAQKELTSGSEEA